jgi:hypothetical protein
LSQRAESVFHALSEIVVDFNTRGSNRGSGVLSSVAFSP